MSHFADLPNHAPPPKKSSGLKILLIVLAIGGGVMLLACGGCVGAMVWFGRSAMSTDPVTVRKTADEIAEVEPPEGYEPMFAMNMFGMKMVAFGEQSENQGKVLMLMKFPTGMADEEQMRQQMNQSLQQQGGNQNLQEISSESKPYTIRGQECQVRIAKAKDDSGREFRQITAVFTAKDGSPAMLMMMMPEEEWANGGEQAFEQMLQSMQ